MTTLQRERDTLTVDCPQTREGAPLPARLQYRANAWSEWSKLLFQLLSAKMHLIYSPLIEDISDIKLIRTDTTLDLSQKAEKRWSLTACSKYIGITTG